MNRLTKHVKRWLVAAGALSILIMASESAAQSVEPGSMGSPLSVLQSASDRDLLGMTRLIVDEQLVGQLTNVMHIRLVDFPLGRSADGQDRSVSLTLQSISVLVPESRFVLQSHPDVQEVLTPPEVLMFGGRVDGQPNSNVFLSFSEFGTYGWIQIDDTLNVISSGPAGGDKAIVIFDPRQVPTDLFKWADFVCDVIRVAEPPAAEQGASDGTYPCRKVKVAIETDYEYLAWLFGGNQNAAQAYVMTLIGAATQIYTNTMNLKLELVFLRLWPTPNDPWNATQYVNQLVQFRDVWNDTMTAVQRNVAHFLSGRELGGGAAYLGSACLTATAYAISTELNGFFPYPLQNNHPWNWDIKVFTHETAHTFGAIHTHEHCPPFDQCPPPSYWGICQNAQICSSAGTIMSYCHLCPGGQSNIVLALDAPNLPLMDEHLNAVSAMCTLLCVQNDVCAEAPLIAAGIHPFSTVEANSQGPDEPNSCGSSGSPSIDHDVWFKYLAQCTGSATVNLCDATYDAKIAVYSSACPSMPGQAIACSDNVCGMAPQLSFPVTNNTVYRLRIGGNGGVGSGTMVITCVSGPTCPADVTGDKQVNVADLLTVIGAWGPCPAPPATCPADTNADGQVNVTDLLTIIESWGPCD